MTYDPFAEMAARKKVYGWTMALWEEGNTCPSLFRHVSDWKENNRVPSGALWTAMLDASWLPYPLRRWMGWAAHHDRFGDVWSRCHYWSNFEIADLDFFRSRQYQDLFGYLDSKEGFYKERVSPMSMSMLPLMPPPPLPPVLLLTRLVHQWGDAAVHSLAVGMLVEPERVHHFSDFAYRHGGYRQCPANAAGGQLEGSVALGDAQYSPEADDGVGCRCSCDATKPFNFPGYCINKLKQPTRPDRPWFTWFL